MSDSFMTSQKPVLPPEGVRALPVGPSWHEQDPVLRDMWMQNQPPQAISDALGRSIPAIMTRAARLGLPRRAAPGRKPGRRLIDAMGQPAPAEQRRTAPRPTITKEAAPQTSLRICLMCLTKFESAGKHNRICSSCKGSSEYETASALPNIHMSST